MPAIATSMIAATGSAARAAAQPQDQSQAPAEDSPFAILLAALSTQGVPAGDAGDATAPSDAGSPQIDQAGQPGKPVPAASEKSNASDHVAQAALAALLNTTATPPPFSPPPISPSPISSPAAEPSETTASLPDAPATTLADKGKPKSAGANPQIDAGVPSTPALISAPIDPAPSSNSPVAPPTDTSDSKIADTSVPGTPVDPAPLASTTDPVAPLNVTGDKATRVADASTADAAPPGKTQPEKKLEEPDQSDAAPALAAAAYAAPAIAGQPSPDQTANTAKTVDSPATAALAANAAPEAGAKPAKDIPVPGPAALPDAHDADPSAAADAAPEDAGAISTLLALATRTAAAPAKSAGVNSKPAANKDAAPGMPVSISQDRPQVPAHDAMSVGNHATAQKTDTSASSGDNTKPVQADPTPATVSAAAAATAHAAPPSQPAAIFDPSLIAPPHAASASPSGAAPAAGLEIANAAADPTPDLNGFAVSIAARSLSGAKQFEIRLDPPELGRVDVRLSIDAAGKAVAHMATDQPQTLDLLRKDAPALTQALRDAGLDVSQNGLNFSLRGQDRQNGDSQSGTQGRKSALSARLAIQAAQAPSALAYAGAASNTRLDIHV